MKKSRILGTTYIICALLSIALQLFLATKCGGDNVMFCLYFILSSVTFSLLAFDDAMWGFCSFACVSVILNIVCTSGNYVFYMITVVSAVLSILLIRLLSKKLRMGSAIASIAGLFSRYAIIHYSLLLFRPEDFTTGAYETVKALFSLPALIASLISCVLVILIRPLVVMLNKGNDEECGDDNIG